MDKDRIKGSAEQAKGAVKAATGKILGDSKLEGEGKGSAGEGQGPECRRQPEGYLARKVKANGLGWEPIYHPSPQSTIGFTPTPEATGAFG